MTTTLVVAVLLMAQIGGRCPGPDDGFQAIGDRSIVLQPPSLPEWYKTIDARLQWEDSVDAQKDVTELAQFYEQHPETRFWVTMLLSDANCKRQADTAEVYKPIIPTLIAHLFDYENRAQATRSDALRVLSNLRPLLPLELLQPAIQLSYWETFPVATYIPLHIVAMFCKHNGAIVALRDATALDQPPEKRAIGFQAIGEAARNGCRNPELVDAILQGLQSDPVEQVSISTPVTVNTPSGPQTTTVTRIDRKSHKDDYIDVLDAAVGAAGSFGPEAEPLKKDLQRLAADKGHPLTATTATLALKQIGESR